MKKNFISKVITGTLIAMAAVSISSAAVNVAMANNSDDTPFNFSFDYGSSDETEVRPKEDGSAAYMTCTYCDGTDYGYSATVYGCNGYAKNGSMKCSNPYNYYEGTTRYHSNTVKSNGKGYAYFRASLNVYDVAAYKGLWSPDNVNCYD